MTTINLSDQTPEKQKRNTKLVQSTLMLMILFGIAKVISLGQTVIIAQFFGLDSRWDAYVTANGIPELIVTLISGGALGHAFIPIFSSYLARGEQIDGYRLASHVVNTIFTVALVISGIVFFLTPWIVPNFLLDSSVVAPETIQQTIAMMRLLLIGTIIFAVSGIFSSILHSHNNFLLPALAPIMYDLGILFGVVFLLRPFGIYGVAIGTVIGAAAHLLIQVPGLIRNGVRWTPEIGFRNPQLWRVIRLMLPRILGLFVFQFNFIIMRRIASSLGEGSISALDWGWRLMQIPQTLIGTAMGIVIFPTLAALSEINDKDGKRNAMSGALKFIMVASIPSAIGLILVGQPLLSLLERGAFDADASKLVYSTLSAFTLGLIVHSMLEVIARSFYADKDTLTPLWAALGGAGINLVLSVWLSGILMSENPPIENVMWLAFANSMGVAFEVAVLVVLLRKRWNGINENSVLVTTLKTLIASLIMGVGVLAVGQIFTILGLEGRLMFTLIQLGLQVLVGGMIFITATLLLGMQEVKDIIRILLRRNNAELESIQTA
ncbi:MAG: murein biosynthesis integral membrane protein MurJ [Phototrophicaceae bacterium]